MSYDSVLLVPVALLSIALAVLALATIPFVRIGSLSWVPMACLGLAAAGALLLALDATCFIAMTRPSCSFCVGWAQHHCDALRAWERARIARSYIPYVLPSFVAYSVPAVALRIVERRSKWFERMLTVPMIPLVVVLGFFVYPKLALPPENDVSWSWGYVREWLDAGAPLRDGSSCIRVAEISDTTQPLVGTVPDDERQRATSRCRTYCETHHLDRDWNPGMAENLCDRKSLFE